MKLVDPDGDSIIINGKSKIYYNEGMNYQGSDPFISKSINALNEIYSSGGEEGKKLISDLTKSSFNYQIEERLNERSEFVADSKYQASMALRNIPDEYKSLPQFRKGSGGSIYWNTDGYPILTTAGPQNNITFQLLHEMCHASDAMLGILGDEAEQSACYQSNIIARNMGLPLQSVYGGTLNRNGTVSGGSKLLDESGNPIPPHNR